MMAQADVDRIAAEMLAGLECDEHVVDARLGECAMCGATFEPRWVWPVRFVIVAALAAASIAATLAVR